MKYLHTQSSISNYLKTKEKKKKNCAATTKQCSFTEYAFDDILND